MKLVQFNRTGFVKFEILDLSLIVTTVEFFDVKKRMVLLDDIELHVLEEERVPKVSNFWLGLIFFAMCFLKMEQTFLFYKKYLWTYIILGGISLYFFWHYIVPAKVIQIGVTNDKMIVIHKWRPHKWKVKRFLKQLEKEIELKKKKT